MAAAEFAPMPLAVCRRCGLAQWLGEVPVGWRQHCRRCAAALLPRGESGVWRQASAALAAAALILYPPAILLPVLRIEKLGSSSEDSIVTGVVHLFAEGHAAIAAIVLIFSLIVPPAKLLAILLLSVGAFPANRAWQAQAHAAVDALGRWGMLDVLVVALLIAFVKLGDSVQIAPGPGLVGFAVCVLLSLLASMVFPADALWEDA